MTNPETPSPKNKMAPSPVAYIAPDIFERLKAGQGGMFPISNSKFRDEELTVPLYAEAPQTNLAGGQALADIAAERRRQIETEGWSTARDDEHTNGELALAAGSYCESAARSKLLARKPGGAFAVPKLWPLSWSRDWWKPKSPRQDLVRAGALIIAEIERLDRAAARGN
ncbi:hypothetical protein DEM27_19840 [Metarhizobium album]|uniref:Uncharacterized protein n=1 Tax=Metarhizobium album TaxID=2182425 RepID=A0A2U2DM61_9HYPH|nr:hypothetical protein [Rhizobium album]PWE54369.1 hypothetical protein DEM27_19840 [Rhizobium album]